MSYAINTLQWAAKEVESMLEQVAQLESKFDPEVKAAAEALLPGLLAEKVAAGEYIAKGDVEAAVAAAKQEATQAAETAFHRLLIDLGGWAAHARCLAWQAELAGSGGKAVAVDDMDENGEVRPLIEWRGCFHRETIRCLVDGL